MNKFVISASINNGLYSLNNFFSISIILFLFGCGGGFDQDVEGPSVSLLYPEAGYVVSDSVEIRFEVNDISQVFKMNLIVNGVDTYPMNTEFSTPNIFYIMLDVTDFEPGGIRIQGVAEDEFRNEGSSPEIEVFVDNSLRFINIASGVYLDSDNLESNISYDYQMMTYPVTLGQYLIFLNEAHEKNELVISSNRIKGIVGGYLKNFIEWGDSSMVHHLGAITIENDEFRAIDSSYINHPITGVTWHGATAFAENYKLRLPSVSEWEKVARGINGYIYPWGNQIDDNKANFDESNDPWESGTTPVDYYSSDSKSAFGAYDMAGNVWEWTADYIYGSGYILKGGSYQNPSFNQTTILENTSFPEYFREHFGFRCVRNL